VLTQDRLDETVPIHNAAMAERTFIEWDKDDIDELKLMKVDILALGMLTCIAKAFAMIESRYGTRYDLQTVPGDGDDVYDMLCRGESIGVFQVESRAQMNMLPRLRPRELYDLCIQVAIVRPGPIQGNMVHPYLRRRQGLEKPVYPSPGPRYPQDELRGVLEKTLGVPLFQEQVMRLAITAAEFTPSEANQLRRAMATFRNVGTMNKFEIKMVEGMVKRGYERDFAERCYRQIEGFGSYGFPESHALAFARLVWISSWLKCRYPAIFAAALLNSQPMGFYAPAQIVRDARENGVEVLPIDINHSDWDNSLENNALRLGLRQITGFRKGWADAMAAARPFASIEALARHAALPERALRLLADADACGSLRLDRRDAAWEALRTPSASLPLFAAADARELGVEPDANLPLLTPGEQVAADYQTIRLSLKAHPMALLRRHFLKETPCADLVRTKNGARISLAGIVLLRQRPGTAKGTIFVTLEDEGGVANLIVWPQVFEAYRPIVMGARLLRIEGQVQRQGDVIHVVTRKLADRSALLGTLIDGASRAYEAPPHAHYPSRDFH
jgi:error-prone DNA polymerase